MALFLRLGFLFYLSWSSALASPNSAVIGVLAFNGKPQAIQRWQAMADYLSSEVHGYDFKIKPLSLDEFPHAINKSDIHFLLTNPGHYVQLEVKSGATRLVTFQTHYQQKVLTQLSGVLFVRKSSDIKTLQDLKGKTVVAVSQNAFGGFQMIQDIAHEQNINLLDDMTVKWLGFPHADIVQAVMLNKADAGIIRAGVLEKMDKKGLIDQSSLRVLEEKKDQGFPFKHSTRLYPEWPFASLPSTNTDLAKQVALALLNMPKDHQAAVLANGAGWTIPQDYMQVHEVFKRLQIAPYPPVPLTLNHFWQAYRTWIVATLLLLLLSLLSLVRIFKANQSLHLSENALKQQQNTLEDTVQQRTDELLQVNHTLQADIEQRIVIEKEMLTACDTLQGWYAIAVRNDLNREQRLQSIFDMLRQYLDTDKALLFRYHKEPQSFYLSLSSPKEQSIESPFSTVFSLSAMTTKELQPHRVEGKWQDYLACSVNASNQFQYLFEFVIPWKKGGENTRSFPKDKIHNRIVHLLMLWISNEMALLESEHQVAQQLDILKQYFIDISPREKDVLTLLVKGESNKGMAKLLHISPKTVELHRANLLKKTGAKSSMALVSIAVQSGIVG